MLKVQVIYFSDANRAEIVGLCKSWTLNWTSGLDYGLKFELKSGLMHNSMLIIFY